MEGLQDHQWNVNLYDDGRLEDGIVNNQSNFIIFRNSYD